jgi:hypothetical protein
MDGVTRARVARHSRSGRGMPGLQAPFGIEHPHVIQPTAVYTVEDLRGIFKLGSSSVRREVRLGRLRIAKRCGRYVCLGEWVLEWIEGGELRRRAGRRDTLEPATLECDQS